MAQKNRATSTVEYSRTMLSDPAPLGKEYLPTARKILLDSWFSVVT
jgi:hypothetical protein